MGFVYLGLAIVLELLGTTFLKYTLGFTKLSPSLVVVAAYTGAFYFLSRSLQFIDLNIAYATWGYRCRCRGHHFNAGLSRKHQRHRPVSNFGRQRRSSAEPVWTFTLS
ncbi:MAG: DMT family transporter [Phascolarctobacterium faecium]